MKVYTVCDVHFEYNDNYSYSTEGQSGKPVKGFRSRDKAHQERDIMEREAKIAECPSDFCWDGHPWGNDRLPQLRQITGLSEADLTDAYGIPEHWGDLDDEAKLELWRIAENVETTFFTVHEMDIEDCKVRS